MTLSFLQRRRCLTVALALLALAPSCHADDPTTPPTEATGAGHWKTAYYKRGFNGPIATYFAGGEGCTYRSRIVLPFDGTKVRVTATPLLETETIITKLTLVRAKEGNETGVTEGSPIPLLFKGEPQLAMPARGRDVTSDATDGVIKKGVWYLQQSYGSPKSNYAYNVDTTFYQAGDQHNNPEKLSSSARSTWSGNVFRVDVFTEDTRPTILCYGDSITHGYGATPNEGKTYPEVLGRLTGLPTLNLGVNGDSIKQASGLPNLAKQLRGVETVILLMGINDILGNSIKTSDEYAQIARTLIAGVKQNGKKIYLGTITPSQGVKQFDRKPEKETLRQDINTWIREKSRADGVIDFDAALRDPENLGRLRADCQTDWIHPNDAGYQKMAEAAAAVLQKQQ